MWQSAHTYPFIITSLQLKQKLWHFKDYLYFWRRVEPPFSFFLKWFLYLQISTAAYINIQPLCLQKKKKNQRPLKKGNDSIVSIFSFHCINWHEEYNQISLLTVTYMLLQEREKHHLAACICCQDFSYLFLSFFSGKSVSIMALLLKLWGICQTSTFWTCAHLLDT